MNDALGIFHNIGLYAPLSGDFLARVLIANSTLRVEGRQLEEKDVELGGVVIKEQIRLVTKDETPQRTLVLEGEKRDIGGPFFKWGVHVELDYRDNSGPLICHAYSDDTDCAICQKLEHLVHLMRLPYARNHVSYLVRRYNRQRKPMVGCLCR